MKNYIKMARKRISMMTISLDLRKYKRMKGYMSVPGSMSVV